MIQTQLLSFLLKHIGAGIPFYLAFGETPNSTAAIGARIAYQIAVEVIPDALRSVRRMRNPLPNSTLLLNKF